ncbi:hypothetical protein [Streptomyces sp. NPDC058486]|uniref:hypothetical protein n=1 Tax=unclassified Streptomyces TaxID=2593676 RepID=UPI003648B628
MKNTMKNALAACAATVLLAGTAACSSDGDTRPAATERVSHAARSSAPTACSGGTYTWFNVERRDVLTGVAEKETLGKGGGRLTRAIARLHSPRTAVTMETGPAVDAAAALRSLGAHIGGGGEDSSFAEAGRTAPDLDPGITDVQGAGTIVQYSFVRLATGDFRYSCPGGKPSAGRATSWIVDGTGILDCDEPAKVLKDSAPGRDAARLSCGPKAPATKG